MPYLQNYKEFGVEIYNQKNWGFNLTSKNVLLQGEL